MASPKRTPAKSTTKKANSDIERMTARYIEARSMLVRAGRSLHDHIGSSLSAAGMQLQLLRMDVPAVETRIDQTLRILEETLGRVRDLSDELCPSPAYRGGLKHALSQLAESQSSESRSIVLEYSATVVVPAEMTVALYETAGAVLGEALHKGAHRVSISVKGTNSLAIRIADDGRKSGRTRALSAIGALARQQGLGFDCTTGKGTIVSIRYATRRPSRR
jgi:signal transduction histidine kinase